MALWTLKWTVNCPDCAPLPITPQLRKLRTAARSALHAIKNTQVKMSHVLRHRDRDNCDGMRQLDSCTKHCSRAWFRMTFGEAGVRGEHRRQRQLTCALFNICGAERTKALGALIWAYKSASLFSEGRILNSTRILQRGPQSSRAREQVKSKPQCDKPTQVITIKGSWVFFFFLQNAD